jgi:hypothetical protein
MKDHELCFSVCRFIENCSEMQTNSLLTTAIDLQNPPRDVHKFIAGHCSQSSETGTTWSTVCHGAHCKLCLRLSLTQPSALCYSLQSDCQLAKCFSFQPQNVICKRSWNSALAEVEEENVTTIFAPLLLCFI